MIPKSIREHTRLFLADTFAGSATPRTINDGWCESYAWGLALIIPDAEPCWGHDLAAEEGEFPDANEAWAHYGAHCFVRINGRYYDSETPEGVDDWRELPYFLRG